MRDAANLAWKLAAIVHQRAPDALLNTYQREREPHVRAIVELAVGFGRLICTTDVAVAAARDVQLLAEHHDAADAAQTHRNSSNSSAGTIALSYDRTATSTQPGPWATSPSAFVAAQPAL